MSVQACLKERTDRLMRCRCGIVLLVATLWMLMGEARGQISLETAVDLSVRNSPRVKIAQADVDKAQASLSESRDVFIPNATAGGGGYGRSYGYPQGQPSVLNINTGSLVFTFSQRDFIRAAHSGLTAADYALLDARDAVAEDAVLTYLAVAHDEARLLALRQQRALGEKLVGILEDRLSVGQDTAINLTAARLSSAQLRLSVLHTEDALADDRLHLEHLTRLPAAGLGSAEAVPELPELSAADEMAAPTSSPGIRAAFATAEAKFETAFGEGRYLYRPQVSFGAQYSRISTFNNANYLQYFGRRDAEGNLLPFPSNSFGIGLEVSVPFLDYGHKAKARESMAEANRAQREAEQMRDQFTEGQMKVRRSAMELAARVEVARLDQELAQQQLDILLVQLRSGTGNPEGPQMTPKDEQSARIAEREKFLALLDARFEMQQAEVTLLRQAGGLEAWLRSVSGAAPVSGGAAGGRVSGKPIP